jgi:hypothetical protein
MTLNDAETKPGEVDETQVSSIDETTSKPVSRFTRWYRSPLFNVIIVGLISFTQPGIWNALNSMFATPILT